MKKLLFSCFGLLLLGCQNNTSTQQTTKSQSETTQTTQESTTTTTQLTTRQQTTQSETTSINTKLDVYKSEDEQFSVRAGNRWVSDKLSQAHTLELVGYRSRVTLFFKMANTTHTQLEDIAKESFANEAKETSIGQLPLLPLKNTPHPTIKSIYETTINKEKVVLTFYLVNYEGYYISVYGKVKADLFNDIREELDMIVKSITRENKSTN